MEEMMGAVGNVGFPITVIKDLSSYPNNCTYGIECCHTDIYLHQEIAGWKDFHRWWINNPDDWQAIKWLVKAKMNKGENSMDFK